jgi:hypothetical protein
MHTMYRCFLAPAALALAAFATAAPATAQVVRQFPQDALRGTITFGQPPVIALNGKPARLSPGARIRGMDNMLVMSGALVDRKAIVNYTVEDNGGLVQEVWILTPAEIKKQPWPTTPAQAAAWTFVPAAQTWIKP